MADTEPPWLAGAIVRAMERRGFHVDRGPGEINVIYIEGMNPDGVKNDDIPDKWNDLRCVVQFADGKPFLSYIEPATTEPGKYYTDNPLKIAGAARIEVNYQAQAWTVDFHQGNRNHEALCQRAALVKVRRDKNRDHQRDGDLVDPGMHGINQHHGGDGSPVSIGKHSAGCLVVRSVARHKDFMHAVKTSAQYKDDPKAAFYTAIFLASEVLAARDATDQPQPKPTDTPMPPASNVVRLTGAALIKMWPDVPPAVIRAFVDRQHELDRVGITKTRRRLAYFLANVGHETGGFAIKNLTENINYTHARAAQVWPNRFSSASDVANRFGRSPGWQLKMFDEVYGNRMGNRPSTNDGSRYIGRGGPQVTGRDGYREVGKLAGLDLEANPELATRPEHQPAISAAFWDWKKLNTPADDEEFETVVRRWNGGLNGLPDRLARLKSCQLIIDKLTMDAATVGVAVGVPAPTPATPPKPPPDVPTPVVVQPKPKPVAETGAAGAVVVAGGAVATQAVSSGMPWLAIALIVAATAVLAVTAWFVVRGWKAQ